MAERQSIQLTLSDKEITADNVVLTISTAIEALIGTGANVDLRTLDLRVFRDCHTVPGEPDEELLSRDQFLTIRASALAFERVV